MASPFLTDRTALPAAAGARLRHAQPPPVARLAPQAGELTAGPCGDSGRPVPSPGPVASLPEYPNGCVRSRV